MTDNQKPTWLRDAERYVKAMQRDEAQRREREHRLVEVIARQTSEICELHGRCGMPPYKNPLQDEKENAELEAKECKELAQNE